MAPSDHEKSDERRRLLAVQELERRRIADTLHNDTMQLLAVAAMRVDLLAAALGSPDAPAKLESVRASVFDAIDCVRSTLLQVHPLSLEHDGLGAALAEAAQRVLEGTAVRVEAEISLAREPALGVASATFRIAHEAFVNVGKHSHASTMSYHVQNDGDDVQMRIIDNGAGFTVPPAFDERGGGLGFANELARIAGGRFRVQSAPGAGTTVEFALPG
jgi:signal transduction histidine kinase